ncbi:NAD dependent epimerase/dehydratase family protein [anaerobic digester metagenome]
MTRVLVTCVGSGVGQSVVDSLNMTNKYYIIGVDTNYNVYGHHFCNNFYIVPNLYSVGYIEFILELCIKEKIDIVIPGHDHELSLLSEKIDLFSESGIKVIVSEPFIISISRDKYKWFKYFTEEGCSIVPTFRVSDYKKSPVANIFPAIVKPIGGSASQGISIIHNMDSLEGLNDDDIIQPYLFPLKSDENYNMIRHAVENNKFVQMSEISIQLLFSATSEFSGIFISKNVLKSGVPVFVDPIQPEKFEFLDEVMKFVPILKKNKVKGPVNIQGRITDNGLFFFEMNMRFTGITGNRAQLGWNEVEFLVNNFLGITYKLDGYSQNKVGVRQVTCTTLPRINTPKEKRIITVFGGSSFIGSSFIESAIAGNFFERINLIVRKDSTKKIDSYSRGSVFTYFVNDPIVDNILAQSDVVVNFTSALANSSDSEIFSAILFQYEQSRRIMKGNVPLVINISSQSVYNQKLDCSKDENADVVLDNSYAFQKRISELFYNELNYAFPRMKVVSLRLSRVFGCNTVGRFQPGFFVNVIKSLYEGNKVVVGNPNNKINLINIKDVLSAIYFVLNYKDLSCFPNVINVGCENISLRDYCNMVLQVLDLKDRTDLIEYGNYEEVTSSSMIDDSVFKSKLGWMNSFDTIGSIKELYDLFSKRK